MKQDLKNLVLGLLDCILVIPRFVVGCLYFVWLFTFGLVIDLICLEVRLRRERRDLKRKVAEMRYGRSK